MSEARLIAEQVRTGQRSAVAVTEDALAAIAQRDPHIVAVTRLLGEVALDQACAIDAQVAAGIDPGPLAGVPFGVKDLFDVAGLPTTAGAAMLRDAPPAQADAEAVRRLKAAGAVLVATLNMDEFAYGFATVNAAFGTTRNPHDTARLAGGSSGGSAAAVAGGMLPLTLGSDTNGSIRVPAALCGVYGLRPTQGALPMEGVYPFVDSFDTIGPFAASLADLKLAWKMLRGVDDDAGSERVAMLGGWFAQDLHPDMAEGMRAVAWHFDAPTVELPDVARARSAAFLMTAAEGGTRHLPELRRRPLAFDPATRDRLIAGAMLPTPAYLAAQRFRQRFTAEALRLFERFDVLIAPVTSEPAPTIDDPTITVGGAKVPARAHLGMLCQPLSFIGLPVIAAPLLRPGFLPLGVQLIGRPGGEAALFRLAERLEAAGLTGVTPPST